MLDFHRFLFFLCNYMLNFRIHRLRRCIWNPIINTFHKIISIYFFLEIEKVLIVIRLKFQYIGVILIADLFKNSIKWKHYDANLFHIWILIDPAQDILSLLVLNKSSSTLNTVSWPLSLQMRTFLVDKSYVNRPALTAYLFYPFILLKQL